MGEEADNHRSVSSMKAVQATVKGWREIADVCLKPYPALRMAFMMGVLVMLQPVGAVS